MTTAAWIAVMNHGRIEQLGEPEELYERPRTPFVAGFLGVSNLLAGNAEGGAPCVSRIGTTVRAETNGRTGPVAAGVRPEKIALGTGGAASTA